MSFGPDSFGPPADSYEGDRGSRGGGQSKFRIIPLVLTVIFGIAAIVCAVMSFGLTGELTSAEEGLKANLLLAGVASFVGILVAGRKIVRK